VARGQGVADQHAEVVADDGEAIVAQRGHQGGHAVGEGGSVVTGGGFVAGTHAAQVGGDDGEVLGEGGHDQPPAVPELGPAGQEQQGGPSPPLTACRVGPPVSTVWLVNVSVNSPGRSGTSMTVKGMVVPPRDAGRQTKRMMYPVRP
jgi:hypothetical protein